MSEKNKLTGWHVLAILCGFFGIIFAVNIAFTVFAVNTFPGEQVKKSYVQGLNYNQSLADRKRQAELGWRAEIGFETQADGNAILVSNWFDKTDQALVQLDVQAKIIRPASEENMQEVILSGDGPGRYAKTLSELTEGVWHIEITAINPDGDQATAFKTLTW